MTRLSVHLPRVGALVLAAVVALVAYSVQAGQSSVPAQQTGARVAPQAGEPGLVPTLKMEEGGQPGRRARTPSRVRRTHEASTRAQAPAAAPEGQAGVQLVSAPGFEPVAAPAPSSKPPAPRARRNGHGGSPRERTGLLDAPSGPGRGERRAGNAPDPLSEVFEPLDVPAAPETPAPPPATEPAAPAAPASPSPAPQDPAGEDVDVDDVDDPADDPADEPVDEPDAVPPPPAAEPPPASVDPDDQTGNADDEDAGQDEQDGEAEDESPEPPDTSEDADAEEP